MNDGSSLGSLLLLLLPLLLIVYMMISTRKRQRAMEEFSASLEVGDEVVTTSGFYGRVTALDTTSAQLELAPGVVVKVDRRAVGAKGADLSPGSDAGAAGTDAPGDAK